MVHPSLRLTVVRKWLKCGVLERLEDFINVAPVRFDSVESFLNIAPEKVDSEVDCIKKVQADELHAAEIASQASTRVPSCLTRALRCTLAMGKICVGRPRTEVLPQMSTPSFVMEDSGLRKTQVDVVS